MRGFHRWGVPPLKFCLLLDMYSLAAKDDLSDVEYRRARHVISEITRTQEAVKVLNSSDSSDCDVRFGKLMNESHESLK